MDQDPGALKAAVRLDALHEGAHQLDFELTAAELELGTTEHELPTPISAALVVRRAAETFTVSGVLRWQLAGECYRCLAPASHALEVPLRLVIQRRRASADEQQAVADDDEAALCDPGVSHYDLRPLFRETILVESPVRVSCSEDCKGLCSRCGQDLNQGPCPCSSQPTDARWAALKSVRFR